MHGLQPFLILLEIRGTVKTVSLSHSQGDDKKKLTYNQHGATRWDQTKPHAQARAPPVSSPMLPLVQYSAEQYQKERPRLRRGAARH